MGRAGGGQQMGLHGVCDTVAPQGGRNREEEEPGAGPRQRDRCPAAAGARGLHAGTLR